MAETLEILIEETEGVSVMEGIQVEEEDHFKGFQIDRDLEVLLVEDGRRLQDEVQDHHHHQEDSHDHLLLEEYLGHAHLLLEEDSQDRLRQEECQDRLHQGLENAHSLALRALLEKEWFPDLGLALDPLLSVEDPALDLFLRGIVDSGIKCLRSSCRFN